FGKQQVAAGCAVLAIKSEMLPQAVKSLGSLQEHLDFPASIPDCLARLAQDRPVVLLIDQLDALCDLMDVHTDRLATLMALIDAVVEIDGLHVIVSCRRFEYEHDVRLSKLGLQEIEVAPLTWDQVNPVLTVRGIDAANWPESFREIL